MNPVFASEIDVNELEFSELRPYGKGQIAYVNYKSKPLVIQTPSMKCPYGLSHFTADGERSKYSLDLSFGGNSKNIGTLKEVLESIDEKVLDESTKKSLAWFKKKSQSRDVSQALYTSSVKVATENGEPTDKYAPTFKTKVPNYDGKFKVQCYDDEKKPLDNTDMSSLIPKGQAVRALVKLSGVWFAGGKFGITWELQQLKLTPRSQIKDYAFADDSDDDENEDGNTSEVPPVAEPTGESEYVLDSEDEL
tara:strand:- start:7070 stop:7819 length:750 start_codon:yes stop_codon:yes gene_type:complete